MNLDKTIHYIGFYTKEGNPNHYIEYPSCNGKMSYIISCLTRMELNVHILSLGESHHKSTKPVSERKGVLTIHYVGTIAGCIWLLGKPLSRIYLLIQVLFYLLFTVKRHDTVIMYHSLATLTIARLAKKLRPHLDIIYEIEEIYAAAYRRSQSQIDKERRAVLFTNKYIVVNDLLCNEIQKCIPNALAVVCYGTYKTYKGLNYREVTANDKINLVYAGVIGDYESDVYLAIGAMNYLPKNFCLKIVGYGSESSLSLLQERLEGTSNIIFDGLKKGPEYDQYLSACDIGMCPRKLSNELSTYTFPSKVLVYLAHGLTPVCSRIDCISKSSIANHIVFIDELSPKGVAKAVLRAKDQLAQRSRETVLEKLDQDFQTQLYKLLQ